MTIGLIQERKDPPDKRVALTPKQCQLAMEQNRGLKIIVERSPIRAFPDAAYANLGIELVDDVSEADVLIGVKEVPIAALIPNKTYLFFSHTLKEQPYNRELFLAILKKNIQLVDHETLTYANGSRVLGFGRYAGIVGAFNGFRTWGIRMGTFNLKPANQCADKKEMEAELAKAVLPENMRILLTGGGRVAHGAVEVLELAGIKQVAPEEFLAGASGRVYTQLDVEDYNIPPEGKEWNKQDFYNDPSDFRPGLRPYIDQTQLYISGHYWDHRAPHLITKEDLENGAKELQVVADVSCDITEPIACTIRPSTIADPIYGYHRTEHRECDPKDANAVAVMAVDNLPCELPKDASEGFGAVLLKEVIPELIKEDSDLIERASMTKNGDLTPHFEYLREYVNGGN